MDPIAAYGEHGDACIEVHHAATQVAAMAEGHDRAEKFLASAISGRLREPSGDTF